MEKTSSLTEDLAKAAAIKKQMFALLSGLEQAAAGHPIEKTGAWRHHPGVWAAEHLKPSTTSKKLN